jgi:hypothetical protein
MGLIAFFLIALGLWLGFVQVVGDWLWNLLHGM